MRHSLHHRVRFDHASAEIIRLGVALASSDSKLEALNFLLNSKVPLRRILRVISEPARRRRGDHAPPPLADAS